MSIIAIPGGSRESILELVKESKKEWPETVHFIIYDHEENVDTQGCWEYIKCEDEQDSVYQAVSCVASNKADIILKGGVKTHTLLKEVLKSEHNLKTQDLLSHVSLVNLPSLDRPLLLTDAGMNIQPDEAQLEQIVKNAIEVAKKIGMNHPKVALLSAAENFNAKMPSSVLARDLTERLKDYKDASVFGPLSLDLALSKEAVKKKRFEGPIKGDADILVVPNIDVGNVLYKSFLLFNEAVMGGTIVGTKVPIVLTSRSDGAENKLYALKFALMQLDTKK